MKEMEDEKMVDKMMEVKEKEKLIKEVIKHVRWGKADAGGREDAERT